MVDPLGHASKLERDENGNVIKSIDAKGSQTSYVYDVMNKLTQLESANGGKIQYRYDLLGREIETIDPNGHITQYVYDQLNHLVSVTDALKHKTHYQYDQIGNLISVTNANGQSTKYSYDNRKKLVGIIDAIGQSQAFRYDGNGNLIEQVRQNEEKVSYKYDLRGLLTEITYPDGSQVKNTYDELQRRMQMEGPEGTTNYVYDALNRLVHVTNYDNETVSYSYTSTGQRSSIKYPDGKEIKYEYDLMDRMIQANTWLGSAGYQYNEVGNLVQSTLPNGVKNLYTYNSVGQLVNQKTLNNTSKVLYQQQFSYDLAGNVVQTKKEDEETDQVTEYSYDALDQLIKVVEGNKSRTYSYDPVGNRLINKEVELTDDGVTSSEVTYTYDAINRLSSVTEQNGETRQFAYDTLGNLNKIFSLENGREKIFSSYIFDVTNHLAEVTNQKQDKTYFAYDGDGNRIAMAVELGTPKENGNDHDKKKGNNGKHSGRNPNSDLEAINSLVAEPPKNFKEKSNYALFEGLLTDKGSSNNEHLSSLSNANNRSGNQDNDKGTNNNGNSNNGNGNENKGTNGKSDEKHGKGYAYGKYKNRFKDSEFKENSYVYNFINDIATPLPTVLMTTNEEGLLVDSQAYGMGLIGKTYITSNDPNNGWENNPNNSDQTVGQAEPSKPQNRNEKVKGQARGNSPSDTPILEDQQIPTDQMQFYYLQDRLGSVVGITDPTGKEVVKYHYNEFGVSHSDKKFDKNWPGPNNTYGYTGLEYDYTTDLNYARARYYMPEIGRFISKDPIAGSFEAPLSQNGYSYVINNPLKWYDPSGKSPDGVERKSNLQEVLSTPQNRIDWVDGFFNRHKGSLGINYGNDIVAFMNWEMISGRLGNETGKGGSLYWKLANGAMIGDMMLAETLIANGQEDQASPQVRSWIQFIKNPSQPNLWLAHNLSIFYVSKILIESGLTQRETPAEQSFIDSVLIRVGLTPVIAPGGPYVPSWTGGIGFFIDHQPLEYPKHYPATWDDRATYPFWVIDEEWRKIYER